jgi:hypothetical protein
VLCHLLEPAIGTLPRHVLRAVVGEHLLGRTVGANPVAQDLEDKRGRLTGVQPKTDEEPAVVVEECNQVNALVLPLEREGKKPGSESSSPSPSVPWSVRPGS